MAWACEKQNFTVQTSIRNVAIGEYNSLARKAKRSRLNKRVAINSIIGKAKIDVAVENWHRWKRFDDWINANKSFWVDGALGTGASKLKTNHKLTTATN